MNHMKTIAKSSEEMRNIFENNLIKLIAQKDVFIFVATPYSMKNKDRVDHCQIAARFNKNMYAFVRKGIIAKLRWRRFSMFPWKRVYFYRTKEELDYAMGELMMICMKEAQKQKKKRIGREENTGYA